MAYYALLVGMSAYQHIDPLNNASKDACDLKLVLYQNGYSPDHVLLPCDEHATGNAFDELTFP